MRECILEAGGEQRNNEWGPALARGAVRDLKVSDAVLGGEGGLLGIQRGEQELRLPSSFIHSAGGRPGLLNV